MSPRKVSPSPKAGALTHRPPRPVFRDLKDARDLYQPTDGLIEAVEVALHLGVPLLITGEPGTGKTQVAYWLAWRYGVEVEPKQLKDGRWQGGLFRLDVRSTTTAEDLTASFDTVRYFHAANRRHDEVELDRAPYVMPGPLHKAFRAHGPSVILIDEIDKASRDFPNDLLNALDQHQFTIRETGERVELPPGLPPPLVIITSNTERRLPAPFLRRCVYHHIVMGPEILQQAEAAHLALIDPNAKGDRASPRALAMAKEARAQLLSLRRLPLIKKPSTGEYLAWLAMLLARPQIQPEHLSLGVSHRSLPLISLLIKTHEDRLKLGLDPTR